MRISSAGLDRIKSHEGIRLTAYPDPGTGGDPWTIGYGSTTNVKPGMRITQREANERLQQDIQRFEKAVNRLVTVPLNQNQFDALVSFAFNVGEGNLGKSTLLRMLNEGDYWAAARQFGRWINAGGRPMAGLIARRNDERRIFETPVDADNHHWYDEVDKK